MVLIIWPVFQDRFDLAYESQVPKPEQVIVRFYLMRITATYKILHCSISL
jgi:hypothetical protein